MTRSADLNQRVAFDRPSPGLDGYGGTADGWSPPEDAVICLAHFLYLRGGETVQAARLSGRQPVVVTIRSAAAVRQITPDWRMRDLRSGFVFNIRSIVETSDRRFMEITVERGVAIGTPMKE